LAQTLSVAFTPTNPANYNATTQTTQINVIQGGGGTPANLVVTAVLSTVHATTPPSVWVTYTVANTGGSPALDVLFTSLTLGGGGPYAPFPLIVGTGTIPAGGQATLGLISFESVGPSGTRTVLGFAGTYNGTKTGIAFGGNIRVTQP
jgi:hypothetical protein